ncbi:MAG TPA: hypothetical protein VGA11_04050, partial [Acidimicrobiia bacterium]
RARGPRIPRGASARAQAQHHRRGPARLMARARRRRRRSLTGRLASSALRRAVTSGSRTWWYVGAIATGFRVLGRLLGSRDDVQIFRLRPGQGLEIRELPRER